MEFRWISDFHGFTSRRRWIIFDWQQMRRTAIVDVRTRLIDRSIFVDRIPENSISSVHITNGWLSTREQCVRDSTSREDRWPRPRWSVGVYGRTGVGRNGSSRQGMMVAYVRRGLVWNNLDTWIFVARALQALCDPYCQSTCLCVGNCEAKYLGN